MMAPSHAGTPEMDNALVLVDDLAILVINGSIREKFVGPNKLFQLHIGFQMKDRITVLNFDPTFPVKFRNY